MIGWKPHAYFAARTACLPTWTWHNLEGHRDFLNLWLIVDGRGQWTSHGRTFQLSAGDCFVQRLWHECIGTTDSTNPLVVLWSNISLFDHLGASIALRSVDDARLPALYRRINDLAFVSKLALRMIKCFEQHGPGPESDRWLSCLWDEIASSDSVDAHHNLILESLMANVRAEPERAWKVSGMAAAAHMPVDRFSRHFHKQTGSSPREFLIRARLDQAKAQLRMSSLTIGEIAIRLGFCDIYHFSRRFKQHVGCSPRAYRDGAG
jgi:AraC-like DNA-binding protein